jgi:murein DD-endopeptidase MepM/ murein hydrolase activator NlpD
VLSSLLILSLAAPVPVWFDPPAPRLGELVIIYADNADPSVEGGVAQILGYEVTLHRVSAGMLRGVAPIPMDIEAKKYAVHVMLGEEEIDTELRVAPRVWETSELKVSRKFTTRKPPALRARLRREQRQFTDLWDRAPTAPKFVGKVSAPVPGIKTSNFGVQRVFNGKKRSTHFGLDLEGKPGDPIHPVADGRVVLSEMRWASGGTIVVDHGSGLFTMYFHMSKRAAKVGEIVKTTDIIGEVGQTGRVTGPHLHLAAVVRCVRLSGPRKGDARSMYVDPEALLGLDLKGHPAFVTPVPEVAHN